MTKMERIERRLRTDASWQAMRETFFSEWDAAHKTVLEHYGPKAANNVTNWFYAHASRMTDERWPDVD